MFKAKKKSKKGKKRHEKDRKEESKARKLTKQLTWRQIKPQDPTEIPFYRVVK